MEVAELTPGLWRWTTAHPDWTPEQGGPEDGAGGRLGVLRGGWRRPADRPARPRGRAGTRALWARSPATPAADAAHVVLTCEWHARSSASSSPLRRGYVAPIRRAGAPPCGRRGGRRRARGRGAALALGTRRARRRRHAARDGAGGVRLCPDSWLGDRDPAEVRAESGPASRLADRARAARARRRRHGRGGETRLLVHLPLDDAAVL